LGAQDGQSTPQVSVSHAAGRVIGIVDEQQTRTPVGKPAQFGWVRSKTAFGVEPKSPWLRSGEDHGLAIDRVAQLRNQDIVPLLDIRQWQVSQPFLAPDQHLDLSLRIDMHAVATRQPSGDRFAQLGCSLLRRVAMVSRPADRLGHPIEQFSGSRSIRIADTEVDDVDTSVPRAPLSGVELREQVRRQLAQTSHPLDLSAGYQRTKTAPRAPRPRGLRPALYTDATQNPAVAPDWFRSVSRPALPFASSSRCSRCTDPSGRSPSEPGQPSRYRHWRDTG